MLPPLFEAFKNPNADVRKAVVFCLVDMYMVLGEQLTPRTHTHTPNTQEPPATVNPHCRSSPPPTPLFPPPNQLLPPAPTPLSLPPRVQRPCKSHNRPPLCSHSPSPRACPRAADLAVLSTSQLKLVTIYINRTAKARADRTNSPPSGGATPVGVQ